MAAFFIFIVAELLFTVLCVRAIKQNMLYVANYTIVKRKVKRVFFNPFTSHPLSYCTPLYHKLEITKSFSLCIFKSKSDLDFFLFNKIEFS